MHLNFNIDVQQINSNMAVNYRQPIFYTYLFPETDIIIYLLL